MALEYSKVMYSDKPFLSIITRIYKRPQGLSKNQLSIDGLTDKDCEQIFITDNVGVGMLEANKAFSHTQVIDMIEGEYVFLLDDDDFIVNPEMITDLKEACSSAVIGTPDVIFFRMTIKNGMNNDHYPTEQCWLNKPLIAHIGGSCFVVKTEVYKKFIHNFGHARCGDFYFINSVFEGGASQCWLDKLMCETGKVSRGKSE
jgi:hypothetical protein